MTEIRALIADDEPLARRGIRQLLAAHADVVVVGECRDGREALQALATQRPDLLFLDVQMPELDGLGVIREYGYDRMPAVIFVTAHDRFAVRAFETHALDYLVKPVSAERFAVALERVRERRQTAELRDVARRLGALLAASDAHARHDAGAAEPARRARRLVVPTATGELVVDANEVDWIQADDYYAAIHARGRRHLIRESLSSLERRLDPLRFVRVHRAAIVQVDRVRELRTASGGECVVLLRDGTRIPVSRRRREQVAELLRRAAG